jgi:hypothetical protein
LFSFDVMSGEETEEVGTERRKPQGGEVDEAFNDDVLFARQVRSLGLCEQGVILSYIIRAKNGELYAMKQGDKVEYFQGTLGGAIGYDPCLTVMAGKDWFYFSIPQMTKSISKALSTIYTIDADRWRYHGSTRMTLSDGSYYFTPLEFPRDEVLDTPGWIRATVVTTRPQKGDLGGGCQPEAQAPILLTTPFTAGVFKAASSASESREGDIRNAVAQGAANEEEQEKKAAMEAAEMYAAEEHNAGSPQTDVEPETVDEIQPVPPAPSELIAEFRSLILDEMD